MGASSTFSIPVVTYSSIIINWTREDLKKLDHKTGKLMAMKKMHHPKAEIDRLYLQRISEGKDLIQIEATDKTKNDRPGGMRQ